MSCRLERDYLLCSEVQAGTEMIHMRGSVGQYKCYNVTVSGFVHGAECSFLLFSFAAMIDCGLCVIVFALEYVQS